MDFIELAKRRESCRAYDEERAVEREKLMRCFEAARLAPSACNSQPWRYVAVTEPDKVKDMVSCVHDGIVPINRFAKQVPAFVAVVEGAVKLSAKISGKVSEQKYAQMDLGLSVANFCLAATEQGLGTCIMGWFKEEKVKALLNIPEGLKVRLIIAVGYPQNSEPREKSRRPIEDTVCFEKYSF